MGWSISWLATKDVDRAGVLRCFGLHAVDCPKEYPKGLMSGISMPNGYYVHFLNKCFHSFVAPEVLSRVSRDCEIVGCQVEEHIMASAAFCWRDGVRLWNVVHEAEKGVRNLQVEGTSPGSLTGLIAEAKKQQDKERTVPFIPSPWEVDHYFRVPIDLAASIVGYEHHRAKYPWGSPIYEPLAEGIAT